MINLKQLKLLLKCQQQLRILKDLNRRFWEFRKLSKDDWYQCTYLIEQRKIGRSEILYEDYLFGLSYLYCKNLQQVLQIQKWNKFNKRIVRYFQVYSELVLIEYQKSKRNTKELIDYFDQKIFKDQVVDLLNWINSYDPLTL